MYILCALFFAFAVNALPIPSRTDKLAHVFDEKAAERDAKKQLEKLAQFKDKTSRETFLQHLLVEKEATLFKVSLARDHVIAKLAVEIGRLKSEKDNLLSEASIVMSRGLIEILEGKLLKNIPGGETLPEGYKQYSSTDDRAYRWHYKLDTTKKLPAHQRPAELNKLFEVLNNKKGGTLDENIKEFASRMKEAYTYLSDELHVRLLLRLQGLTHDYAVTIPEEQVWVVHAVMLIFKRVKVSLPKIPK